MQTTSLENLFSSVAEKYGLKVAELSSGSRRREVVEAQHRLTASECSKPI
jgi:chromosomal replication initiation ATPase DnaA